jgi:CHAT domain-containing protein/tetratricopeptide (TPR) repeat protein
MFGGALRSRARRRLSLLMWGPVIAVAIVGAWGAWRGKSVPLPVSAAALLPSSRTRPIEARVSGLRWAPFVAETPVATRSGETRGDALDAQKYQRAGLVELLTGDPRAAIGALEKASAANQSAVWTDLTAAYYEVAVRHAVPELFANALAAADRALAMEPDHAEALFNRALVLEHLGLRADAREAWSRYLAIEAESGWSGEARAHLRTLAPKRPFLETLDADYDRIGRDPAAAAAIYASDKFAARGLGVVEVLGRWSQASMKGDERDATRHLNVARQLGHVVAGGGDRMLERAVEAIDRAADRRVLAAAHADFYAGMKTFWIPRPEAAEPLLRRAAAAFRQAGSPMAFPAAHWAANCLYEQGRRDEAEQQIAGLLADTPEEFPAYRAFMLLQLANCRNGRGRWGDAIELFEQSAALFERLGETGNVANVRRLVAAVYDRTGDVEAAWKNRLAALGDQGDRTNLVDERTVWSIIEAAIVRDDWQVVSSFLTVYVEINRRIANDVELANALLLRAVVRDRLDDTRAALDIAEARQVAARVHDASYQEMLRVAEWRAVAMLRSTAPASADALLTRAIDYESTHGRANVLPNLLLLRSRARRRAHDTARALDDVERGIELMEQHRESLPAGAARWGAFHSAEELFDEAVELSIGARAHEAAFHFTEKSRARSLLDSYGASPVADVRKIPPGTVVVEYASLPSGLVIFTADARGIHAVQTTITRDALANDVAALHRALRNNESSEAALRAATLYAKLAEPVAHRLAGATTLVFVPDAVTANMPFSVLRDTKGRYLLETHAVLVAPSTSAFLVATERKRRVQAPRSALVVTASSSGTAGQKLTFVDAEASRILRCYRQPDRIGEDAAQFDELIERSRFADVIHFSGHAVGDSRGFEPASILLRNGAEERRVGVAEIAKLRFDRTAVVVLAGCGTARGNRRAAEGVISVAHGFLSAGVPSAIATLWPISDDLAARFFPRVHERLAAGLAPAEALREVQLEAIRKGDIPASMWAAVQVIGS